MVARTDDTVAGAGDHHLRQLETGVIRGRKAAVGRQRLNGGVLQVPLNDVPQIVDFFQTGLVGFYPLRLK